jgi:two-component system phosphate regulon response regulator PhoB
MTPRVLVVDSDLAVVDLLRSHLEQAGCEVITAYTGTEALSKVETERPNLVLLELTLPEKDGLEVCLEIRRDQVNATIPIVMLTARASEIDRIVGLEMGADDYIAKPFSPRELVLRVQNLLHLRKTVDKEPGVLRFEDLVIDWPRHDVTFRRRPIILTAVEFKLLTILAQKRGVVQTREQLLEEIWGDSHLVNSRTVDSHMQRLRAKLGPGGRHLETIRGVGYRFQNDT